MKKNQIYFGLLILALIVTIVWTSMGMLGVNRVEKTYTMFRRVFYPARRKKRH